MRVQPRSAALFLVAVVTIIWVSGPFLPPPPNARAVALAALALWLLPLWAHWIERHRLPRRS